MKPKIKQLYNVKNHSRCWELTVKLKDHNCCETYHYKFITLSKALNWLAVLYYSGQVVR